MHARRNIILVTTVLVVALAACSDARPASPFASPDANQKPTTLLTIGGSATEGDGVANRYRDAWPYLVFNKSLPRSASLVNAALDGATVANTLLDQLPLAQEVKPDTVAIWLGADDLLQRTPIGRFSDQLHQLIESLRAAGAHKILVADLPSAYGRDSGMYNAAIRRVVHATNTTLVELQRAPISLAPTDGLPDQPTTASDQLVADAFDRALQPAP
jgi:lysophospholipase L1-like esterase